MRSAANRPARTGPDPAAPLLEVEDLRVEFPYRRSTTHAVNGLDYALRPGQTLAIVGESGSGKSMAARAVMGIVPAPGVVSGAVRLRGVDILSLSRRDRVAIRGERISMVFQDALAALNPVLTVGRQIAEMFQARRGTPRADAKRRAVELLDMVRIPAAHQRVDDYPHQFSGGMRQRVLIAMALALDPEVLLADEPTTALDVTVQAQIMQLLAEIQQERGMGIVLMTHDIGVVADVADDVLVMYAGRAAEHAPTEQLYTRPAHPYTRGLLRSIPRPRAKGEPLATIPGAPPDLSRIPAGCAFHPRCDYAVERCTKNVPPGYRVGPDRISACHRWQEVIGS